MTDSANADQAAFWNADPGRRWVSSGDDLDAMQAAVNDILLAACAPEPGEAILDVGCGAGATALAFAAAVGPSGRVLGLDVSEPLAARAAERAQAAGLPQIQVAVGDAQTMPLPASAFDAAVSRFGVMFFADPVAAFRNIASALRPGGRIAFAAWSGIDANPWFRLTYRVAADRLGEAPPQPPDAPGPMAFANRARVVGLLEAAGLADATATSVPTALHHPGGAPALVDLSTIVSPASRLIRDKAATAADVAAIRDGLASALAPFATADGIRIPAEIVLYRARRP